MFSYKQNTFTAVRPGYKSTLHVLRSFLHREINYPDWSFNQIYNKNKILNKYKIKVKWLKSFGSYFSAPKIILHLKYLLGFTIHNYIAIILPQENKITVPLNVTEKEIDIMQDKVSSTIKERHLLPELDLYNLNVIASPLRYVIIKHYSPLSFLQISLLYLYRHILNATRCFMQL